MRLIVDVKLQETKVMSHPNKKNEAAQALGRKGGKKTAEKGKDYMRELGRRGALKRWGKINEEKQP